MHLSRQAIVDFWRRFRAANSARSALGAVLCAAIVFFVTLAPARPASALVIGDMSGTTSPPDDDPGWNYVAGSGSLSYTYLGNGWALSAFHVFSKPTVTGDEVLNFPGGSFNMIANQPLYKVKNPASSGWSEYTDLRLVRINVDESFADPNFSIASQTVLENAANKRVVMIGAGRSRQDYDVKWNVEVVPNTPPNPPPPNDIWTEVSPNQGNRNGYRALTSDDDVKRWGENLLDDADSTFGGDNTNLNFRFQVGLGTGGTSIHDIKSFATKFDAPYLLGGVNGTPVHTSEGGAIANTKWLPKETQVVPNDSGSAVFYKRNGQWELIGIVNAQYSPYENRPNLSAVFGDYTVFADLSYYRNEILSIMNSAEAESYWVPGDLNFDGVASGDGTGSIESDDLSAFVAGWNYDNLTGEGTLLSWKKGDLNRDGKVDVTDFFMLRNVLNMPGAASLTLQSVLGSVGVPEPASALLAVAATAWIVLGRRRRRSLRAA